MEPSGYRFEPATVVRTLQERQSQTIGGLFSLTSREQGWILASPWGDFSVSQAECSAVDPDPLWESAAGICAHMEEDHGDTFPLFLQSAGHEGLSWERISMPWVEREGFFLALHSEERTDHRWVPFPQPCDGANEVRKALIKMLRVVRHGS